MKIISSVLINGGVHIAVNGFCECENRPVKQKWDGSKLEWICLRCFSELENIKQYHIYDQMELDL